MRHHNIVFHDLLKRIPWGVFERLVDKHRADARIRRLTSKGQFVALLFAQLAGAQSLREIEAGLKSHSARLYHLGGQCVARSTLADANAKRPAALYADLFAHMASTAGRAARRHIKDAVCILDATRIELTSLSKGWLTTAQGHRAIKLHIALDPVNAMPLRATTTDQRVNDITPAKAMPIEPGLTYVFDLGYYDFGWWHEMHAKGCRFVTRLKSHSHLTITHEQAVPAGQSDILFDRIGCLSKRLSYTRRNPFTDPVREIGVRIATGKTIRLVTNDLEAPAAEIAALYKQRWQVELFFKWIKQNLKIVRFLGASENAVRAQIFVALIAYLLLRLAHAAQTAVQRPLCFVNLVRFNLMHKRQITALTTPPPTRPCNTAQLAFDLTPI